MAQKGKKARKAGQKNKKGQVSPANKETRSSSGRKLPRYSLGIPTRRVRILVQGLVFLLWVALILSTRHPMENWIAENIPVSLFLRMDPLVTTVVSGGMRMAVTITMLGLVTLIVTLILGRVFCGWVCPLGTVFDFYGWFLRRLRVRFEGPSPKWFRAKYYLLAVILLFAAMGAVSPLMGLDPIVLITRVAATVINPFFLNSEQFTWAVGDLPSDLGYFVDFATLILFLGIMGATTKVSRIWCRTACPLGAYLAVSSRHSALRRHTEGCIHCDICSNHCPTGAISFKNPEVYNESECIKCFSCSQECPVDANFFTLRSPIPEEKYEYYPVSLNRRKLVGTLAAGALAAPLVRTSAGDPASQKTLIRPPMSREEHDFLASCIRCTECIQACPTGVLKTARLNFGLRAFWSPVMVGKEGYCMEGCNACSEACPTDAIMKYPIEKKYTYKSGTAVFDSSHCIAYTENKFCNECVRACPTDAIPVKQGWEPPAGDDGVVRGSDTPAPKGKLPSRPTGIDFDRCVGCAACEYECHKIVYGEVAMKTTSYGRAVASRLD